MFEELDERVLGHVLGSVDVVEDQIDRAHDVRELHREQEVVLRVGVAHRVSPPPVDTRADPIMTPGGVWRIRAHGSHPSQ